VVAVRLGREFRLPVVITARGSDTSQLPRYAWPRRQIQAAMGEVAALIAVSAGLKEGLVALGAPPDKVTVLRNGVDLETFRPPPNRAVPGAPVLLSVGHLIPRKGHDLVIGALPSLPGHRLIVVGEGPQRRALEALARRLGVADRVWLAGTRPHAGLRDFYAAADVMILASSHEGWANVLLESMACGTPVIASPAWGSREAVAAPEAGLVLDETTPASIALAVRRLLANPPAREATRAHAERFGWDETTAGSSRSSADWSGEAPRGCRPLAVLPAWPALGQGGVPPPCRSRAGDVVGLLLEGTGAPAGAVAPFGQCFRAGDLPRDAWLGARLADGRPLAVQCDVKTRHPDGSARHAVLALAAPALAAGTRVGVMLTREGRPSPPLDPTSILGQHRRSSGWISSASTSSRCCAQPSPIRPCGPGSPGRSPCRPG
jgi:teichuronic acid biosynthesis glycosyltransferase TuaC